MSEEENEEKIPLKCYKQFCMRPFMYGGTNLIRATCPHCGSKIYLSKARISKHEYNKRWKLWLKALEWYKKEVQKIGLEA